MANIELNGTMPPPSGDKTYFSPTSQLQFNAKGQTLSDLSVLFRSDRLRISP